MILLGANPILPTGFDKLSHRALSLSKRGATQLFRLDSLREYNIKNQKCWHGKMIQSVRIYWI
jgi:hypothetical protein